MREHRTNHFRSWRSRSMCVVWGHAVGTAPLEIPSATKWIALVCYRFWTLELFCTIGLTSWIPGTLDGVIPTSISQLPHSQGFRRALLQTMKARRKLLQLLLQILLGNASSCVCGSNHSVTTHFRYTWPFAKRSQLTLWQKLCHWFSVITWQGFSRADPPKLVICIEGWATPHTPQYYSCFHLFDQFNYKWRFRADCTSLFRFVAFAGCCRYNSSFNSRYCVSCNAIGQFMARHRQPRLTTKATPSFLLCGFPNTGIFRYLPSKGAIQLFVHKTFCGNELTARRSVVWTRKLENHTGSLSLRCFGSGTRFRLKLSHILSKVLIMPLAESCLGQSLDCFYVSLETQISEKPETPFDCVGVSNRVHSTKLSPL